MKVLIADDDPTTVQYLATGLSGKGFEVVTAADAMQAVMRAVRSVPDVILLDIKMPGGTGLTALRRIKQSSKTVMVPVIAITGSPTDEIRREVLELGAVDCLEKPIDVDMIAAMIEEIVGA